MPVVTFKGLVTAWNPVARHAYQLIVCCMSRTGPKMYHPISLEGDFTTGLPDFTPEIGHYAYGVAKLLKIADGSILVEFMKDRFQTIASDTCLDFNGEPLPYVHSPRADRYMCLKAKEFYRLRLPADYYPNQSSWNTRKRPFGCLAPSLLAKAGDSMAKLAGHALFIKNIKNNREIKALQKCTFATCENNASKKPYGRGKGKNAKEKFALFLLADITREIHNATFMITRMEKDFPLPRGSIYQFSELPILAVEDDMREEESTIFCGKDSFEAIHNPNDDLLLQFHDELGNCEMMPDWLWEKYFSGKLERTAIQKFKRDITGTLSARGVDIPSHVHGWWYYWGPVYRLKAQGEDEVAILAPYFRDAGPPRVIIAPMAVYRKNRKQFPKYSSVVSVCEDPQIMEGVFRPEPGSRELIKSWIIANRHGLEKDWLDIDDIEIF